MAQRHEGSAQRRNPFDQAHRWLSRKGGVELRSSDGERFQATASVCAKGFHRGDRVIKFMSKGREATRAYECCWEHHTNCNRTPIQLYCAPLDAAVGR